MNSLKKICQYKLNFKDKPWITFGIQKSICIKNKLLKKFINKKEQKKRMSFMKNMKDTEATSIH